MNYNSFTFNKGSTIFSNFVNESFCLEHIGTLCTDFILKSLAKAFSSEINIYHNYIHPQKVKLTITPNYDLILQYKFPVSTMVLDYINSFNAIVIYPEKNCYPCYTKGVLSSIENVIWVVFQFSFIKIILL